MNKFNDKKWMYWFTLAVAIILVYNLFDNIEGVSAFFGRLGDILSPFFGGILIAYILYMPVKKFESIFTKSKMKLIRKKSRGLSIITVFLIIISLIVIASNIIFPILTESITDFALNFETYYKEALSSYEKLPSDSILKSEEIQNVVDEIQNINIFEYINFDNVMKYAQDAINAVTGIVDIFIAIIVSIFILLQRTRIIGAIKRLINAIFEERTYKNLNKIFNNSNQVFFRFLAGQFLDAIVVGILTTIVMTIMGVEYAPLLGFLIGIFNMIPYVGAIIAVALSALITIVTGGLSQAVWMLIVVTIVQQIDANIINPKIIGNSLKISPLVVIFAITVGGAYFGILGMFLSVPVCAVFLIIIDDYIEYKNLLKKQKEQEKQELLKNNTK